MAVTVLGGEGYRLPTKSEWEYACRAGSKAAYCFGDDVSQLGNYAWYGENSGGTTHPVSEKKPNGFGLYDMREWCWDWFGDYPTTALVQQIVLILVLVTRGEVHWFQ